MNSGAFAFAPGASISTGGVEPRQISAGDMDGDGDADFVISHRDSNNVAVVRNTGGALSLVGGPAPEMQALGEGAAKVPAAVPSQRAPLL